MSAEIAKLFHEDVSDLAKRRGCTALERLAAWWIREEVLADLGQCDASAIGELRAGEFVLLLKREGLSSVVHEGLAIPVRWKQGAKSDQRLPRSLAQLAATIAKSTTNNASPSFSLALGEDCPDLSAIDIAAESAGAMLAATLEAARLGAALDATVTASAVWGGSDLGPVDGLNAKIAAAKRLKLTRVFVSRFQFPIDACDSELSERLEGKNQQQQVQTLVLALDAPPLLGSFDDRCTWYHRQAQHAASRARVQKFFCTSLVRDLVERDRSANRPAHARPETLVLVGSGRPESAVFATHIHNPLKVIVLHERGDSGLKYAEQTRSALRDSMHEARVELSPWAPLNTDFETLADAAVTLMRASHGQHPASMHIDLTGGTTKMKFALAQAARRFGSRSFVIDQTDHAKGGTPDVTTLRVIELPHGAAENDPIAN